MEPDKPATQPSHVLRNNLLFVVAAALVLGALVPATDSGSAVLFGLVYGAQVLLNLILGLTHLSKGHITGKSPAPYFLSALLVLLIGFGACSVMLISIVGNLH